VDQSAIRNDLRSSSPRLAAPLHRGGSGFANDAFHVCRTEWISEETRGSGSRGLEHRFSRAGLTKNNDRLFSQEHVCAQIFHQVESLRGLCREAAKIMASSQESPGLRDLSGVLNVRGPEPQGG